MSVVLLAESETNLLDNSPICDKKQYGFKVTTFSNKTVYLGYEIKSITLV